ncbi:uncharacterized protein GIQ15_04487 [Arthroderma uncinatum]|uniref:uncharacterized protein n=1 Tax=Arthroderma uncinatum TaxID=74035 RepID=UPI00144AAC97|nr:uncharacterized protein GIQ15_04487 [Arthroderma uncinatum]KAF3481728.1 hypothetical protein GIQ15_04487 [Arthroderma uncinatum]
MRFSYAVLGFISTFTLVSSLPVTGSTSQSPKHVDAEAEGALYPGSWVKRDKSEAESDAVEGALYPGSWVKRESPNSEGEAEGELYPGSWVKRDNFEAKSDYKEGALYYTRV